MKPLVSIVLLLLITASSFAQKEIVDSLLKLVGDTLAPGNAKLYNEMAFASNYYDWEKSLMFAQKARKAAEANKNIKELANAYRNIGNYHNSKFKIDSARKYFKQSLNLFRKIHHKIGEAKLINQLGILHGMSQDYDSAISYFSNAYEITKSTNDSITLTMIYTNFGLVYYHWGNYELAIKYYELSQEINLALNLKDGLEKNYSNLGKIAYLWDKPNLALDYYRKTYSILNEFGNEKAVANLFIDMGNAHKKLGHSDSSLFYQQKAYDMAEKFGSKRMMSIALSNLANIYRDSSKYDIAMDYLNQSLILLNQTKDKKRIAERLQSIGKIFLLKNELDSALQYLTNALELFENIKYPKLEKDCHYNLYLVFEKKNDPEKALHHYIEYAILKNDLFDEQSQKEFANFEAKYESEKQAARITMLEKEKEINNLKLTRKEQQVNFLVILAVLIIMVGLLLWNRSKLRQKNQMHKMELHSRQAEQRLLRAQMNPHFIFNSLNAIQSYITDNNPDTASRFLAKFGNLIRYNLESTRNAFVPLEQEISALQNNLDLEKMRFENRFDYQFHLSPNIDPKTIKIPPLLIQPFIENAILHGLASITANGLISIEFKKKDKTIVATISDNGIGRKRSAQLKDQNINKKKSLGTKLISERLQLFKSQGHESTSIEIIDLYDEKDHATGTKVVLCVPFEHQF